MTDQQVQPTQQDALVQRLAQLLNQQPQAAAPQMMPAPMQPAAFMQQPFQQQPMPASAMQPMQYPGYQGAFAGGGMPAMNPTGLAVPITVMLPDGREMNCRLMFGAEVLGNLQAFLPALMQQYGQVLKAYQPRQQGWGGGGNGGGGYGGRGYGGRGNGYYGGRRY